MISDACRQQLSPEDLERYSQQYMYTQQIITLYDEEPNNFPKLIDLLQRVSTAVRCCESTDGVAISCFVCPTFLGCHSLCRACMYSKGMPVLDKADAMRNLEQVSLRMQDVACCLLLLRSAQMPCHCPAQTRRQSAPTPSECTHEFCQLNHCNSLLNSCFIGTRLVH